jgi:putative ABC transport system substrate-binding protein
MDRQQFVSLLGGAAALPLPCPLAARAQERERMRRIGVLMNVTADDPEAQARIAAFVQVLQGFGWAVGRNVQIDTRWAKGNADRYRSYAAELVALAPDVIVSAGGTSVGALRQASPTVPIVFVQVSDPVSRGLVQSLSRPGGNATGFIQFEFAISGKWLQLLKEIAPRVARVAVIRNPVQFSGIGQAAAIQSVAPSFGVEVSPIDARNVSEVERSVAAFARTPNGGLIVVASASADIERETIVALAARHGLPAVYPYRFYSADGGLISYGPDITDQFRRAAGYVDRILKGEKPADLPVQAPTKLELVVNAKTAKALGLTVPQALLARADEVIE